MVPKKKTLQTRVHTRGGHSAYTKYIVLLLPYPLVRFSIRTAHDIFTQGARRTSATAPSVRRIHVSVSAAQALTEELYRTHVPGIPQQRIENASSHTSCSSINSAAMEARRKPFDFRSVWPGLQRAPESRLHSMTPRSYCTCSGVQLCIGNYDCTW